MSLEDDTICVVFEKDKEIYYLETGNHSVSNIVDILTTRLATRKKMEVDAKTNFIITKYIQVKEKEYKVIPIYLTSFIKKQIEKAKADAPATVLTW